MPQGLGLGRNRAPEAPRPRAAAPRAQDLTVGDIGTVRIIADDINNALLVLASPQAYEMIEPAIRKLDIVPLQVLVEATIAEVSLTDQLRYGLQYFLQNDLSSQPKLTSTTILNAGSTLPIAAAFPGFSWLITGSSGNPKVILTALENITRLRVISSPHVMIRDNQKAELQVGNEVPILTQQQQSIAANANVVNTIQYRETGVILSVSPHVNASGSISLDIEQEVSSVSQQTAGTDTNLTPTIAQRRIKSSVVVQTGETVVLGGLIQERQNKGTSGIPLLAQLPLIGSLFGTRIDDDDRTELLVLISPRVVRDPNDARRVTDEIRRRLRGLQEN
jgi:general secretion pathway protein D